MNVVVLTSSKKNTVASRPCKTTCNGREVTMWPQGRERVVGNTSDLEAERPESNLAIFSTDSLKLVENAPQSAFMAFCQRGNYQWGTLTSGW